MNNGLKAMLDSIKPMHDEREKLIRGRVYRRWYWILLAAVFVNTILSLKGVFWFYGKFEYLVIVASVYELCFLEMLLRNVYMPRVIFMSQESLRKGCIGATVALLAGDVSLITELVRTHRPAYVAEHGSENFHYMLCFVVLLLLVEVCMYIKFAQAAKQLRKSENNT
ncbi:MAG: hypothetical protein LBN02_08600 [Oscillospiraceae bacterium]|jgi:hypothetical protein|nr:hypothetical protein [Oscillospiraceae bacterium]